MFRGYIHFKIRNDSSTILSLLLLCILLIYWLYCRRVEHERKKCYQDVLFVAMKIASYRLLAK